MKKSWLMYFAYIVVIVLLLSLREYIEKSLRDAYYKFEEPNMLIFVVISLILTMGIGILIGLHSYINESKKLGTWKINFTKLIIIGLPSLYFSLNYIWILSGSKFLRDIIAYPLHLLNRFGFGYVSLFQVIFGYLLITSIYKCEEERLLMEVNL